MRKALAYLALATSVSGCASAQQPAMSLNGPGLGCWPYETAEQCDGRIASGGRRASYQASAPQAAYSSPQADELYCRMQAQMASANADRGGLVYGSIMAAASGNQIYGTCMQMKAAQRY
jgi:hypothetical protein